MSLKKSAFQKNKYSVLKKAISPELAKFVYNYFLNKRNVAKFLFNQKYLNAKLASSGVIAFFKTEYLFFWNADFFNDIFTFQLHFRF